MESETKANGSREHLTFTVESGAVLQRLRTSMSDMLNRMPGRVRSTRDLQKVFNLDLKLCWQVMKLAGPGDALSLAPFVPTPGPMKRFLNAAVGAGVDEPVLKQIRAAYDAFEEQVALHAGDRVTFESMATGSVDAQDGSDEDLRRADVKHRKAGFQMHSHYCGDQLDTYLSASLVHPGAVAGQFDLAHLRTKLGQRRLRAGADFVVDTAKYTVGADNDSERDNFRKESFDPEAFEKYHAPIIPRFCSVPLPTFNTSTDPDGRTVTTVAGDSIGLQSSVNLTFGRFVPNAEMEVLPDGRRHLGQMVGTRIPTALVIADQLLHRPSFPKVEFNMRVNWIPFKFEPFGGEPVEPLPFRERITKLEAGVDGARTREVPQYIEMLEFVCDRLQWKVEDFDVYRVRIEYPLLHSRICTNFTATPVPS